MAPQGLVQGQARSPELGYVVDRAPPPPPGLGDGRSLPYLSSLSL